MKQEELTSRWTKFHSAGCAPNTLTDQEVWEFAQHYLLKGVPAMSDKERALFFLGEHNQRIAAQSEKTGFRMAKLGIFLTTVAVAVGIIQIWVALRPTCH